MKKSVMALAITAILSTPAMAIETEAQWQFNGVLIAKIGDDSTTAVPVNAEFTNKNKCLEFPANFARESVISVTGSSQLHDFVADNLHTVLHGACTSK